MKRIMLSLTLVIVLSFTLLSPTSVASPASLSAEGTKVVLIIKNIYVSMGGSGVNAVRFAEEADPENIIYSEWNDWFVNASYSSGTIPQGTQLNMSVVDGALVAEVKNDGVIKVVFLVDGDTFEVSMSVGVKFEAIKTDAGEYILLEDETRAFQ